MTMVESSKGCVLQWTGHADYVAERFSGLLARQALVDVTLVCEDQKLRVHKLVLASNSTYFEEILQQDLGQEPIIILKDLDFRILKVMIEFMYCGETTVPYHLLPLLLDATKVFKVKQLATVINSMMMPNSNDDFTISTNTEQDLCGSKVENVTVNAADDVYNEYYETEEKECSSHCQTDSNNIDQSNGQSVLNDSVTITEEADIKHILYEEALTLEIAKKQMEASAPIPDATFAEFKQSPLVAEEYKTKSISNETPEIYLNDEDFYNKSSNSSSASDEQCHDLSDSEEHMDTSTSLSQSCFQQIDEDFEEHCSKNVDIPSKVGKCIKVYSHKRRKSVDDVKNKLIDVRTVIPDPSPTECIDLSDEPQNNDIPVTLLTSLDMESAEYIISLSTERIQSIVGATVSDQCKLINCDEIKQIVNCGNAKVNTYKKALCSENMNNSTSTKPVLRRSLRLLQQENDDATNQNEYRSEHGAVEKHFKKSTSPNRVVLYNKTKRKGKDMDCGSLEHSTSNTVQSVKRNNGTSRSHRNNTKLLTKRSNKSTYTANNKEKDEQKIGASSKVVDMSTESKLNSIKHINRALWGDMSDISEDSENRFILEDYTPHTEIPFAVGLLPLRTALEKMQATPDYQPRKTRSSVAPVKQDSNGLKRKIHVTLNSSVTSKKQHFGTNEMETDANTVCHIQIRTAPTQYVRNRKKFSPADVNTIESSPIMN